MKAEELVRLQVALEYRVEGDGLVPLPGSMEQARFIAYRFDGGYARFYRIDIPVQLRLELERIEPVQVFQQPQVVREILNAYRLCPSSGLYESCYFALPPLGSDHPSVVQDGRSFTVQVDGQPVCWAWSERSNDQCAEVAVETMPAFQRRGFARQAVCALAAAEMQKGKVVFYSYEIDNLASQALGHSLGVVYFATCAAFD